MLYLIEITVLLSLFHTNSFFLIASISMQLKFHVEFIFKLVDFDQFTTLSPNCLDFDLIPTIFFTQREKRTSMNSGGTCLIPTIFFTQLFFLALLSESGDTSLIPTIFFTQRPPKTTSRKHSQRFDTNHILYSTRHDFSSVFMPVFEVVSVDLKIRWFW